MHLQTEIVSPAHAPTEIRVAICMPNLHGLQPSVQDHMTRSETNVLPDVQCKIMLFYMFLTLCNSLFITVYNMRKKSPPVLLCL